MTEGFKSKDIFLKAQKKFLGKVTNKKVIKLFIDEQNALLFDNLYKFAKIHTENKKEAEKLMKNIIKITVKLNILYKNDQFDKNELKIAHDFKEKFRELSMIIISFYEIEFSYNKNYLVTYLCKCREVLKELIKRHVTDKTLHRIDIIFDFFSDPMLLDSVYVNRNSNLTETMHILIDCLKEQLDKDQT